MIHDTGAHSHSMGFQYNGKLRAPELLLRLDGRVDMVREREEISCLFDNTMLPEDLKPSPSSLPAAYPYSGRKGRTGSAGVSGAVEELVGAGKRMSALAAVGFFAAGVVAALAIQGGFRGRR